MSNPIDLKRYFLARFSSRKAIISLLLISISTTLLAVSKIDQDHFVSLIEFIIGSYLLGQSAIDISDRIKKANHNAIPTKEE